MGVYLINGGCLWSWSGMTLSESWSLYMYMYSLSRANNNKITKTVRHHIVFLIFIIYIHAEGIYLPSPVIVHSFFQ